MSLTSLITVIASPRPRVGKTFLARMLADFHLHNGRTPAAFDLNGENPDLSEFMPAYTLRSEVGGIHGQMALFDRLVAEDGAHKLVDLGHENYKQFFKVAHEIDLAGEGRKRGVATVFLFLASAEPAAAEAYAALRDDFPQATLVPVHNEFLGPAQYRDKFPPAGPASVLFHVPALTPGLRRIIDRRPFSFVDTSGSAGLDVPLESHLELQRWLRRVFLEFRELELRVLLSDLQNSLQKSL